MNPPLSASELARLRDLHAHVGSALILLAKGGRLHTCKPDAVSVARRHTRKLLTTLSRLIVTVEPLPPLAGSAAP
jgi:hypothetical protein